MDKVIIRKKKQSSLNGGLVIFFLINYVKRHLAYFGKKQNDRSLDRGRYLAYFGNFSLINYFKYDISCYETYLKKRSLQQTRIYID